MKRKAEVDLEDVVYHVGGTVAKKLSSAAGILNDIVEELQDEEGKALLNYLANKGINLEEAINALYDQSQSLSYKLEQISQADVATKKSRLRKVADSADSLRSDRAKMDTGNWMLIDAPPYATSDNSYMGYVNQNPDNVYYKRLIQKTETKPSPYTSEDFVKEYFEDDQFTIKKTK